MLMDGKFEYGIPFVTYQMVHTGNELWEVSIPSRLYEYPPQLFHWRVSDEVRFGWHGFAEVRLDEVCGDRHNWARVELIAMAHILNVHYFTTKDKAVEYMDWYIREYNRRMRDNK